MSVFRFCMCGLVAAALVAAEETPRAKDDREYSLVQQALAERDPAKRLETLDVWSAEYADSVLLKVRSQLYLQAYRETGRTAQAVEAAERLLAIEPSDFAALYTIASLAPSLGSSEAGALSRAEGAANRLLQGGIETQFDPANRPETVAAPVWESARSQTRAAILRTLGWIATQRTDHPEAEARLREALLVEPASAQASYWLAQSVLAQRDPSKNELAFFSLARAATLSGAGELPAESRDQIRAYLEKVYRSYAGTLDGLDELVQLAAASPLPPPETPRVLSAEERRTKAREAFCRERPLECAYRDLRELLDGQQGQATWSELRGKVVPEMALYVVGNEPADRPLALRLSSRKGGRAEVLLQLSNRLREAVPAGRLVKFDGVAQSLAREPFLLTLEGGRLLD